MPYRIPVGTQIAPYASSQQQMGFNRVTTVEVVFDDDEILDRPELRDAEGVSRKYYRLSLGDNPTDFDSYLVEVERVEPI